MKTSKMIAVIALCLGFVLNLWVSASEAEMLPTSMDLKTVRQNKDNRLLEASLVVEDTNGQHPAGGVMVEFFNVTPSGKNKLGEIMTNAKGLGSIDVTRVSALARNDEGYQHFTAVFGGNEFLGPSEAEIQVKDAWLDLEFFFEDSVKNIRYSGFTTAEDGSVIPIADQDIYLFVPRMFSLMPIADGWLESSGTGVVEFPLTLIGDEHGNVEVIARIEDHPEFGTLEARASIDWALTKHPERAEGPLRELWTPIAPTWMIVTLIILLSGVWIHYFYAIYELFRIKRAGKHLDQT